MTRAWPEKKGGEPVDLVYMSPIRPLAIIPLAGWGGGGGGVSKEIYGTVRLPVLRHVSRQ